MESWDSQEALALGSLIFCKAPKLGLPSWLLPSGPLFFVKPQIWDSLLGSCLGVPYFHKALIVGLYAKFPEMITLPRLPPQGQQLFEEPPHPPLFLMKFQVFIHFSAILHPWHRLLALC